VDERTICQLCKNRVNRQCKLTGKFVARKKLCDIEVFRKLKELALKYNIKVMAHGNMVIPI
jgi:hypothetical protein